MPKNESHKISEDISDPIIGLGIAYSANDIQERLDLARRKSHHKFELAWYHAYYASVTFMAQDYMICDIEKWMSENIPSCHSSGEIWKMSPIKNSKISHIQFSVKTPADVELIKKKWVP